MSLPEPFLPHHMVRGMRLYIENGIEPGSFMMSVLCNDLKGAIGRADHVNSQFLGNIVSWLVSNAPSTCWGSEKKVNDWLDKFTITTQESGG